MVNEGKITLKNGLKIFHSRQPSKLCYSALRINSGSTSEPSDRRGLAHFLEHMTLGGSRRFNDFKTLSAKAQEMGFEINASTGAKNIDYPVTVLARNIVPATKLIIDCAFYPLLREDELLKERKTILHELNDWQAKPEYEEGRLFREIFFRGLPESVPTIGREEDLQRIGVKDLRDFHSRYIVPSNANFFLFGNFDEKSLAQIIKLFDTLPIRECPERYRTILPKLEGNERVERDIPGAKNSKCIINYRTSPFNEDEQIPLVLVNGILNGQAQGGLFDRLRQEKRLCYSVGCDLYSDEDFGYMYLHFSTEPSRVNEGIAECDKVISDFNPSDREIRNVKTAYETYIRKKGDSPTASFENFISKELHGRDVDERDKKVLSLTRREIIECARKYLTGKRQIMVLKPVKD